MWRARWPTCTQRPSLPCPHPAPLRPPCPLQRTPFSDGLPQESLAAQSDPPEPAWQKPSLSDPESPRCFLPTANKNPLSFMSLCCLSVTCPGHLWAGAADKAHRPLGAPGCPPALRALALWGLAPLRGVAGMGTGREWSLQGGLGLGGCHGLSPRLVCGPHPLGSVQRAGVLMGSFRTDTAPRKPCLGPAVKHVHPTQHPGGTPETTAVLMLGPPKFPPGCQHRRHLPYTLTHLATSPGV